MTADCVDQRALLLLVSAHQRIFTWGRAEVLPLASRQLVLDVIEALADADDFSIYRVRDLVEVLADRLGHAGVHFLIDCERERVWEVRVRNVSTS